MGRDPRQGHSALLDGHDRSYRNGPARAPGSGSRTPMTCWRGFARNCARAFELARLRAFSDSSRLMPTGNVHRLHGLGPWRRLRGRYARGNASAGAERPISAAATYADRRRGRSYAWTRKCSSFRGPRQRHLSRHLEGQPDGRAGGVKVRRFEGTWATRHRRGGRAP